METKGMGINVVLGFIAGTTLVYLAWAFVGLKLGFFFQSDPMAALMVFAAVMYPIVAGGCTMAALDKVEFVLRPMLFVPQLILGLGCATFVLLDLL